MSIIITVFIACLLSGVAIWFIRQWRRPSIDYGPHQSLTYDRDQMGRLYDSLMRYSQGGLGVTRELRRLSWQLDAYCSLEQESAVLAQRIRETHDQFKQEAYPALLDILRTAESIGFRSDLLVRIEPVLAKVVNVVDGLLRDDLPERVIIAERTDIQVAYRRIESDLLDLRQSVEEYFTTDLGLMLDRLLMLREEEFRRMKVHVDCPGLVPGRRTQCRICPRDLRTVLDGLFDNIVNTATERDLRQLEVNIDANQDAVHCRISFSWFKLPDAYWYLSRTGSGGRSSFDDQNLAPSRQLVRRFGGEVWAEPASETVGTTIVLRLSRVGESMVKEGQA